VNTSKTPERGTARLWRGLVGWPPVLVLLTGIVVFLGSLESGGIIVLVMAMAALIIMPIGLVGLAITSDSTGEKVVSGIVAAVIVLFDVAFTLLVIIISQVGWPALTATNPAAHFRQYVQPRADAYVPICAAHRGRIRRG